jgi:hypothetical protein
VYSYSIPVRLIILKCNLGKSRNLVLRGFLRIPLRDANIKKEFREFRDVVLRGFLRHTPSGC